MVDGITSGYLAFVDSVSGINGQLGNVRRIGSAATIDSFITDVAAVVAIRDIAVVQRLPHAIDLYLPTTRALIDMAPGDLRGCQAERLSCTDARWSGNIAHGRLIVDSDCYGRTISQITVVFSEITNLASIVFIRDVVIVQALPAAVDLNLPSMVGNRCPVVLNVRCRKGETTAGTDGCRSRHIADDRCIVDMDLHGIAGIITAFVAHLVTQIPIVISSRNVVEDEGLIGAIGGLANLPSTNAVAIVCWRGEVQVVARTDGSRGLQHPCHIRSNIDYQLTCWRAINRATATLHHIADIPSIVCRSNVVQAKGTIIARLGRRSHPTLIEDLGTICRKCRSGKIKVAARANRLDLRRLL